jgi:hypothetical protein
LRPKAGDQIAGCLLEQARAAAVNVADLQGPTWNESSIREFDWLIRDLGAFVAQPTERGDRMFAIMAERSSTAITELEAMSLL